MNAFVDPELCIGCTQCAGLCPAVFRMEGVLAVAEPGPIPPEEVPQAVTAAPELPGKRHPHRGISPASLRLLHSLCGSFFAAGRFEMPSALLRA